jgi:chemotaxis protein methyltransferase WspC
MAFKEIKALLQSSIGLHAGTIGDSSIERAISHRMAAIGAIKASAYLTILKKDDDELHELIEEVVVPETWFFRNLVPFETLRECVDELKSSKTYTNNPLRILSVPCSTGEEPYSIAISLMEHGLGKGEFFIDAIDVSKRALIKAERAIYGKHSFREDSKSFKSKYFKRSQSGWHLSPKVREHVNFLQANLLKDTLGPSVDYYDIIFCRNLLIYFDRGTQKSVLEKLHAMLKSSGVLFVGHAETSQIERHLFKKIEVPKAFAYRKQLASANSQLSAHYPAEKLRSIYDQLLEVTQKDIALSKRAKSFKERGKHKDVPADKDEPWQRVAELINHGRLPEASKLCERRLEDNPEDEEGYYFLGLISNLEGSPGAAESFLKKAIYLNPNHHKALGLSALLAEQRGDDEAANSFRRRESRVRDRKA